MKIKRITIILALIIWTTTLSAAPYISGELSLYDSVTINDSNELNETVYSSLILDMNTTSNGVKFYSEGVFIATSNSELNALLNKAYVKYRLPYNDGYMNFQVGKSYYSMGGGLIYNAGNPFLKDNRSVDESTSLIPTSWNAVFSIPLEVDDYYDNLFLSFISTFPLQDDERGLGTLLNLEVGDKNFDNIEISIFAREDELILTSGLKGALYFDYGIFANIDLLDTENFNISLFATKIIDDFTYNVESLYENINQNLEIVPSISYQIDDKSTASISSLLAFNFESSFNYSNTLTAAYSYSIVQGFSFAASLASSFSEDNLVTLGVSMEFEF